MAEVTLSSSIVQRDEDDKYAPLIHFSDGRVVAPPGPWVDTMEEAMKLGSAMLTETAQRLGAHGVKSYRRPGRN